MVYSLDIEEQLATAKCEQYRAEAERRRSWLVAAADVSLRKSVALRLHALANWLEPAAASSCYSPKLKGGL